MRKFTLFLTLALLLVSVGIKAQNSFYMSEGFENWTAGASATIYSGWSKSDYDRGARTTPSINSYLWYAATASPTVTAHGGTKYAYLYAYYTYVQAARLKTPAYAIPRTGSYRISFWLRNGAEAGSQGDFTVYYSFDGGITYLNNPIPGLQHISTGNVWTEYDALLPAACNDTNVTLVFEGASGASTSYYYYLDDIEIASAPTCWAPTNLALSNLTGSSVQFRWDLITKYGVRPDLFSVTMKDAAGNVIYHNPAVAYDTTSITQQLPFTGLQGNTTYTVSVRSNCSASYAGYSDSLSVTFTTLTPAINPPLFQNFDTLTAATFPGTGYYIQNASLNTLNTYSHSGAKSLKLTPTTSGLAYVMFPLMNLVADNFEVDLWIRRAAAETQAVGPVNYKIGYLTDPSNIINLVPIKSGTLSGDASWRNIRFNSYDPSISDPTTPIMIAIQIDAGVATSIYVDDVDIHVKPTCTRPENLTVSNVTTNSAVLAWEMSNASSFNVRAMAPDSTYVTATATSSPFTFTGLAPNTQYQFSVQGICSATDLSDWAIAATAKTQCLVAATPIFDEDFSSWDANSVADCWTTGWFVKPSSNTLATPFTMVSSSGNYHSASKGMSLAQQTDGSISYLTSQKLPIDSANKYMLSIWVKRVSAPSVKNDEGIQIWMTNAPDDTTGGYMLGYIHRDPTLAPVVAAAGWYQYEYIIPVQGNKHVMIVGISESGLATYFDDVEVKLVPNCQKVSNITIDAIQSTSANVAWTPGQSEAQWAVNYELKQGTTTVADTTVISNVINYAIGNLLPATAYTISGYVRAICGAGDTAEAVEFSTSFTTACQAINSLPYTNDFESEPTGTTAAFATCWHRFNDATGTYTYYPYNISNATYSRSGSNSLYFYTTTSTTYAAHQIAVLPPVDTTVYPINTLRLRFWAKRSATSSYADAPMIIGVMSDPTDINTFVAVDTVVVNNTDHQKFIVRLDQYTGNGTHIAIRLDRQSTVCYCYLDDVTLEQIPNCSDLNGDVTLNEVAETSARITLEDATASSSWSYAYGIAGTHVSGMTTVDTTVGTVVISNLASATKYDLYVRRNCGNGNYGTWSEKVSFTTTAAPAEIPYVCGFEDAVENAKWMYVDGASANVFTIGQASTGVYAGSNGMYVTNNRTTAAHTYTTNSSTKAFAYRTIHFDAKGYQIDMKVKATGGQTSYDFGRIFVTSTSEVLPSGCSGLAYASTVFPDAIAELDEDFVYSNCTLLNCSTYTSGNPDANGWVNISYYLDMTTRPGNYNLVLMWHDYNNGGNAAYPLAVDNISITELTCIPPSTINTSIASTSVDLSVVQPTASQWEFIVDNVAFTNDAVPANPKCRISSTDGTATATGLTPNTMYWYSVRTICDTADTSAWLEVESLRTFCAPYAVPYNEGFEDTGAANCWTLAPAMNDDAAMARTTTTKRTGLASITVTKATVVSPEFTVDSLTHYMINGWAFSTTDSATFSVGVMTDPNDGTTFEPFTNVLIPASDKWSEFTAYFTNLEDPYYAEFKSAKHIALATGDNTISFDDIMVDLTPTCPKPTEVLMTNITANSFDISFTNNSTATRWVVYVNDVPRTITTNPATISGLESHTNYEIRIAAICSATDTSFNTECGTITTLCDLVPTPWVCGFEPSEGYTGGTSHSATTNLTVNAENNCWNVLNNRPATATSGNPYSYVTTSTNYVHNGVQGVYMYSHLSYGNMYLVLPEFVDPANMLKVKFWYKNQNASAAYPQLKFGYFTNPDVDTSFVVVEAITSSIAWTEKEIFTNNASYNIPANARLGFMLAKGTSSGAIYLDDISAYLIRNCSDPEAPALSNVTVSTADVTITDTCAAHTAWEYIVVPSGFSPNTATATAVTAKQFTITGLDDETTYDIYVRAVCGVGDVSNYIKASFRTLCTPFHVTAATPFVEDFNNYDYGQYIHNGTCYTLLNEPSAASCWAKVYPTTTPSATATTLYEYGHSANYLDRCLSWTLTASILTEGTVLRPFHLDGGATYEVTAWVRNGQMTTYQSLVTAMAGSSTTNLDTMAFVTCTGFVPRPPAPGAGQSIASLCSLYQEIKYYLTPDSTGDYFIGYKVRNSNGQTTTELYLDDWTITRFAGCTPVTPQVDSVTTNAAYISVDDTTAYQYEYVLNDSTAAPTAVASNRFVVGNLAHSSFYTLYFRRCCNASVHSAWTEIQFTTECGPITTYPYTEGFEGSFPPVCWSQFSYGSPVNNWSASTGAVHSGTKAAYIPDRNAGAKTVLTTGEFMLNNPSGYYLRFWMYRYNDTYNTKIDEALHVGYKNAPITAANIASVNEVLVVNRHVLNYPAVEDPNAAYYMYEVEIPGGVSGSTWFSFDFHNQYGGGIYIDDITIEPIPTCVGPKTVPTVVSSTMTTATVTVNMNYKPKAEVTWALASTPDAIIGRDTTVNGTVVVTGLTPSTMYAFRYRYICSAGDTSAWSNIGVGNTTATNCFAPQNLRTAGIVNDHHAEITWGGAPDAVAYQYELRRATSLVAAATTTADTLAFDSLMTNSQYTIKVRTFCADDTSAWMTMSFKTTYTTFNLPYDCGFENAAQNTGWHFNLLSLSGDNTFTIGTGVNNGGTKSLYVSNDGANYNYNVGSPTVSDAEVLLEIPAGNCYVSYDWQCYGEGTNTFYDYGRVFLVPASAAVSGTTYSAFNTSLPSDAISLDNSHVLNTTASWNNYSSVIAIPTANVYKFVVLWANDGASGTQPPMAIDNIRVEEVACMPVASVNMVSINSRDAMAAVVRHDASVAVEYALSQYDNADSVAAWSVATSDTLSFTGLTPGNEYTLFVRHACDAATKSPAKKVTFSTPVSALNLPFVSTFEANDTLNGYWTMTSGAAANYFAMGSATSASGSRSIYVTNNGSANAYSGAASTSYAYIPIQFTAGMFDVSYKWKCAGESTYDYGHMFLAPASMIPEDNVILSGMAAAALPADAIALDADYTKLNLSNGWVDASAEARIDNAGTYNLIIAWHNDGSTYNQSPLAIDDICIKQLTCPRLKASDISFDAVSTDMFMMNVSGNNPGASIIYHVASDASFTDTVAAGITGDTTITVNGLAASTWYHVRLASLCGVGDTSAFTSVSIRTNCGINTQFPYDENFESYAPGSSNLNELTDNCWNVYAYSPGATVPYHYMTTTESYVHGGSQALYIDNLNTLGTHQTFAMPKVDTLAGKQLSIWYKTYNATSPNLAILEVGYLSNPNDLTTFNTLLYAPASPGEFAEAVVNYPANTPAGARPAFKSTGSYYIYVDDIHMNKVVRGSVYHDTICFGHGYAAHGFSCPAGTLAAGDTLLSHVVRATSAGVADSIISVNIYVRPELNTTFSDTICPGVPYTKGLFNITNPTTRNYFTTFTSVNGCDSTVSLNLYVIPATETIYDTICEGDSYQFGTQTLTQAGTYYDTVPSGQGCNIARILNLHVVATETHQYEQVCAGASFSWEGQNYSQAGTYTKVVPGVAGCSLTKYLHLTVTPTDSTITVSFCQGGSVQIVDTIITTAGSYSFIRLNQATGCHTTYHVTATEITPTPEHVSDQACEGKPYYGYGESGIIITKDTTITQHTRTADGKCDSVVIATVKLNHTTYGKTEYVEIAAGETYTWHDNTYTTSGVYYFDTTNVNGCDSICKLNLTVGGVPPVAVDDVVILNISLIPNPVNAGETSFIYGNFGDVKSVEILNSFGQVVDTFVPAGYPIEVQGINASGIYYVRVTTADDRVAVQKLIVK